MLAAVALTVTAAIASFIMGVDYLPAAALCGNEPTPGCVDGGAGWAATARRLRAEVAPLSERLVDHDAEALGPSFPLAAEVLRHLQADPLLPAELLPPDWPGAELRGAQHAFDAAFKATLTAWLRSSTR